MISKIKINSIFGFMLGCLVGILILMAYNKLINKINFSNQSVPVNIIYYE
jgi:hypothetical protein